MNTQNFLLDQSPDFRAQRSIGTDLPYSGNAMAFYAFASDTWRVSKNLSVDLGLRYEYNGVSQSMKDQALNSVSNVPGVLTLLRAAIPEDQLCATRRVRLFARQPGHDIHSRRVRHRVRSHLRQCWGERAAATSQLPGHLTDYKSDARVPGEWRNHAQRGPNQFQSVTSGWLPIRARLRHDLESWCAA